MEAEFSATPTVRAGCLVLVVEGELDLEEAQKLDAALAACTGDRPVIVDLTAVTFLDSAGLHTLLQERTFGHVAGLVRARGSNVGRLLDIVGVVNAVRLYDDLPHAIGDLGTAA